MSTLRSARRKKVKKRLAERDGDHCYYCLVGFEVGIKPRTVTIDHKVPECRGGTHDEFNLVLACYWCNNKKADMTAEEFLMTASLQKRRVAIFLESDKELKIA